MPKQVRKPPSPSDYSDPRSLEYFFNDLYELGVRVGTRSYDLPSIASGAITTFTITVKGAVPDMQMQLSDVALPSTWNTGLTVTSRFISAVDTVTVAVRNETGSSIDMATANYSIRVFP